MNGHEKVIIKLERMGVEGIKRGKVKEEEEEVELHQKHLQMPLQFFSFSSALSVSLPLFLFSDVSLLLSFSAVSCLFLLSFSVVSFFVCFFFFTKIFPVLTVES